MTTSSHNSTTPSVSVAAASGNNQSQLVATPVPDEQRISFWPQHFGLIPQWVTLEPRLQDFFSLLLRPSCEVFHVVVSTEAHYRDPNFLHKYFFDLFFCLLLFHPFCCIRTQNGAFLHAKRLAQGQ